MIDLNRETVLSLPEAAARLPRRRAGKRPHRNTLYRWASTGFRSVKLETIRVGGTLCTSIEALQRFFAQLAEVVSADHVEAQGNLRPVGGANSGAVPDAPRDGGGDHAG